MHLSTNCLTKVSPKKRKFCFWLVELTLVLEVKQRVVQLLKSKSQSSIVKFLRKIVIFLLGSYLTVQNTFFTFRT